MPSQWMGGTAPLIRRHSGNTTLMRIVSVEGAIKCALHLIAPLSPRRAYVTTTKISRPPTTSPCLPSSSNDNRNPERTDVRIASQSCARSYLDAIQSRLRQHANRLSSTATLNLAEIGEHLNQVTGYQHIEKLKHKIVETEAAITAKRQATRETKAAYEMAVARRSQSQREVNDLLQRKSSWTDADVSRFTALVREDHLHEQEEARAKVQVAVAEAEVETEFNELMRTILNRYHEEQVWSDKIRSVSTYGSLLALGVNICVFILAIIVVEPWKRRMLAQTFERRIEQLSLENREMLGKGMSDLAEHFAKQEVILTELAGASIRTSADRGAGVQANEVAVEPDLPVERTAKTTRDRDLWISGTVGMLSGAVITIILGYFR